MGISLGSSSKKPYVGSKEVQEAYVGSQLVYRATPPYVYAFLGGQNDYMLASWCTLSAKGATIVKEGTNFRIALSAYYETGTGQSPFGKVTMIMPAGAGSVLSFMYKMSAGGGSVAYVKFIGSNNQTLQQNEIPVTLSWTLKNLTVPPNTYKIEIIGGRAGSGNRTTYLDEIRFEET